MIHDDDDDDDRCNEYEVHDDVLSGKDFFLWQSKCESKREDSKHLEADRSLCPGSWIGLDWRIEEGCLLKMICFQGFDRTFYLTIYHYGNIISHFLLTHCTCNNQRNITQLKTTFPLFSNVARPQTFLLSSIGANVAIS